MGAKTYHGRTPRQLGRAGASDVLALCGAATGVATPSSEAAGPSTTPKRSPKVMTARGPSNGGRARGPTEDSAMLSFQTISYTDSYGSCASALLPHLVSATARGRGGSS